MDPVAAPGNPGINTQQGGLTPEYDSGTHHAGERALTGFDPHVLGSGTPGAAPTPTPTGANRPNFSGTAPVQQPGQQQPPGQQAPAAPDSSQWPEWAKEGQQQQSQPGQQQQPQAQPGQTAPTQQGDPANPLVTVHVPGMGEFQVTPERAMEINAFIEKANTDYQQTQTQQLETTWDDYMQQEQAFYGDAGRNLHATLNPAAIDKMVTDDLIDPTVAAQLKNAYSIANAAIRDAYEKAPALVREVAELRHKVGQYESQLKDLNSARTTQSLGSVASEMQARFAGCDMVSVQREGERAIAEGKDAAAVRQVMEAEAQRTAGRQNNYAKAAHQQQVLANAQQRDAQGRFTSGQQQQPQPVTVPPSREPLPPQRSTIPDPGDPAFAVYLAQTMRSIGANRQGT